MRSSLRHTRRVVARYGHARTPCSHLQSRAAAAGQPATQPPPAQTITARIQTRSLSISPSRSSSVNPEEISHFNALASSWWDPLGPSRVLHQMNPLRHDFIRQCQNSSATSSFAPGQKLRYLDVGCGGGIFAESAARLPTTESVTAIDPSTEILAVARRHAARDPALSTTLTYLNKTIDDLPLPTTSATQEDTTTTTTTTRFDVVSLFEVIEHVDNPSAFLDRCGQFVKPGGWLILSTIARTWTSWFTTNLVAEDIIGMVPKGTHDWNKYINEHELREFFRGRPEWWGAPQVFGVVYVPGLGWKEVKGSEKVGNYFFGVQRIQ
ncbi:S-adenosyl-L-methionine-dependent methyltransferase [Diplogelasinospora grovesii]|uniref:Ubiquinone biosynthesis O-methyltransferase, mitochondrial n=1 Tax=Diplogelasinospora grovesii TaxID=303347 RepID=A0AAN6NBC6_9PEZI|nr:S-adenosyl-L-methionine-dependent methyltransferase [Diplogelasinospora grovesii]